MKPKMDSLLKQPREVSPVLPQWAIRPATVLVIAVGAVQPFLEMGHWTQKAALVVIAIGAAFGIYSQGAQR